MSIYRAIMRDWLDYVGKTMATAGIIYLNCFVSTFGIWSLGEFGVVTALMLGVPFVLSNLVFVVSTLYKLWHGDYNHPRPTHHRNHQAPNTYFDLSDLGIFRTNRPVPTQAAEMKDLNERYEAALEKLSVENRRAYEAEAQNMGYTCAITLELMAEPCRAGNTEYWVEKKFLEENINRFGTNPMDRSPMTLADVVMDKKKQTEIQAFVEKIETVAKETPVATQPKAAASNQPSSYRFFNFGFGNKQPEALSQNTDLQIATLKA